MYSCALMDWQQRQIQPCLQPSQAAPPIHDALRNQQAGTVNNSCQYGTVNSRVQLPQSSHGTLYNGAYSNRQMSNLQTSTGPHQVVSSQQTAGGNKASKISLLLSYLQDSSSNQQSQNPCMSATYGFPAATQQDIHQNSTTPHPSLQATYPHQDTSSLWKQSVAINGRQTLRIEAGKTLSEPQYGRVQKGIFQNVNGHSTNPVSTCTTTAYSCPRQQAVCPSTLVSAAAHNRQTAQTAYNQIHKQNSTQHGLSSSKPPPSYDMTVSQPFRNNSIAAHPSSSPQILYVSSMSQKTQQYPAHIYSGHKKRTDATFSNSSNSYKSHEINSVLSKINEVAQQQRISHKVSPDILCKSYTAGSGGCSSVYSSSSYRGQQVVSKDRMTVSIQNMQPVTSVERNATQSLPLHSGQFLSQSTVSRTQQNVNESPQKNSSLHVLVFTRKGNGRGSSKADNEFLPNNNSNARLVGYLSDTAQRVQLPESISPQRNKAPSSSTFTSELTETLSPPKQNDNSIHSSPGCTGTRVVAIVQPLPLKSCQVASEHTSVAENGKGEYLREESNLYPNNPNQINSIKSMASHDGNVLSTSDSGSQNPTQKSEKSAPSEVPVSQDCPKDQSELKTPPTPPVFELAFLPVNLWTAGELKDLILKDEQKQGKVENIEEVAEIPPSTLSLFWGGISKTFKGSLSMGLYKDIIKGVNEFCSTHVSNDTVVLTEVNPSFREQLKNFHVLQNDEVYSAVPYKSSWLNLNEQLDDIDKDFGFPWTWMHRLHIIESDSRQTDQAETVYTPPLVSQMPNKDLSQTELGPVESGEEKQASTIEPPSIQTASPGDTESSTSSDSCYSFKIQVLPPEEARLVFEQVQNKMPQSSDTESQEETVLSSSVESEVPEDIDATRSESKVDNGAVCSIQNVCCIAKWVATFCGSTTNSFTCRCREDQSNKECTDKSFDEEQKVIHEDKNLCEISSESNFHHAKEGENPAKDKENIDSHIMTFSLELDKDLDQTFDLTDDDVKAHSSSDQEPKSISQISNSSPSSLILNLTPSDKDEDLSNSEGETPNQMPDVGIKMSEPEDKCAEEQLKFTGTMQLSGSYSSYKQTKAKKLYCSESEGDIQMSDLGETDGQAQVMSADVAESLLETNGQTQFSTKAALQTSFSHCIKPESAGKLKRLRIHGEVFPILKKSKRCRLPADLDSEHDLEGDDVTDAQPSDSNVQTVKLFLFGSVQQESCISVGDRQRHISPREDATPMPPEVISVKVNPLKRKSSEAFYREEHSVKQRIHDNWRKSFPPTKVSLRKKMKTLKCSSTLCAGSFRREELAVSPKRRVLNRINKRYPSLKKRRSLSKGLKLGEEKTKKDTVTPKQPADNDSMLKFSVLPSDFNFEDGSNRTKETTDPISEKTDLVEENKQRTTKADFTKTKGTWYPNPEKKFVLLRVPQNFSLFHEFQKKYKEKTKLPKDE